jgi:hypothetical protein
MRVKFLLLAAAACVSASPAAHSSAPATGKAVAAAPAKIAFDKADAAKAVNDLATALEENFVFPEAGKAYAAKLRANLAAGAYSSFPDAAAFAEKVTADLQAIHKDGHLRLRPVTAEQRSGRQAPNGGPPDKSAVEKSGWLADGVAYIDFRGFPGNDATVADVRKFLDAHRDAKTLIIDARRNGGGGLAEMNLVFAEIFVEPTTLVVMDIRQAVEEKHGTPFADDDPLLRKVTGPATIIRREHFAVPAAKQGGLRDAKVYLLTSK